MLSSQHDKGVLLPQEKAFKIKKGLNMNDTQEFQRTTIAEVTQDTQTNPSQTESTQENTPTDSTPTNDITSTGSTDTTDSTPQENTESKADSTPTESTQTTQRESITEQLENAMQEVDKQIAQEVKDKKADLANPINPPQSITQADKDRLEKVYTDMQNALTQNANFIIKTDLSLRGITELIAIMRILNDFYLYHVELLKDNKNSIDSAVIDIEAMNKRFSEMVRLANSYIMQALKEMDNANATSLALRNEIEALHDACQLDLADTKNTMQKVTQTYEKLQLIEHNIGNLEQAIEEFERLTENNESLLNDMRDFLNTELNNAIAALMLKKEEYERDLQDNYTGLQEAFNRLLAQLQTQGQDFIVESNQIKTDTINEINSVANNRLQEVKALDTEVNARLTALRDESLQALDTKKTEGLLELETKANELATECNTKKELYLQAITDLSEKSLESITAKGDEKKAELETHTQNFIQEAENKKQEITNTLDSKKAELEQAKENGLNEIRQEASTHETQLQDKLQESLESIKQKGDEKIQEIENNTTQANTNLDSKLQEIEQKTQQVENNVNTMIQEHNTHLNSFATQSQEALNAIKTEGMQEIRTEAQRLLEQIKNNTTTLDQNVRQEYETWLLNLQNKGQEAQTLIQEGINTTIPNALQNSQTELETKKEEHLQSIDSQKESSLESINELTEQTISQLKSTFSFLMSDLTHENFTQTTTWTKPQNVKRVFVNVLGGTGANNATTRGTPSSFGSHVTAQGGVGNAGGNGQFGEMKFSIVDIPDSETDISVSIGAGGSVDIFY